MKCRSSSNGIFHNFNSHGFLTSLIAIINPLEKHLILFYQKFMKYLLILIIIFFIFQLPPLTPGTNKKMYETLPLLFSAWASLAKEHKIPTHPRDWDESHVKIWLQWLRDEFTFAMSLEELLITFPVRF